MKINNLSIERIYPRDIIALVVLTACFILRALGINTYLDVVIGVIVAFYFSKRLYEEKHPNGDLNDKVKELEEKVNEPKMMQAKFNEVKKTTTEVKEPLTTGDFQPLIKNY